METRNRLALTALVVGCLLLLAGTSVPAADDARERCRGEGPMPELTAANTADWIGSEPLTRSDLRGRVVLLNVWTFG